MSFLHTADTLLNSIVWVLHLLSALTLFLTVLVLTGAILIDKWLGHYALVACCLSPQQKIESGSRHVRKLLMIWGSWEFPPPFQWFTGSSLIFEDIVTQIKFQFLF